MGTRSRPRRSAGRLAATALALLLHVGVLGALLASMRPLITPEAPVLEVELVRPDRPTEQRPPDRAAPAEPAPAAPDAPLPQRAARVDPRTPLQIPALAIPSPAPAPPTGPAAPPAPLRPPSEAEDGAERVRRALRTTIGCDEADAIRLSDRERAECRRRLGEARRSGPLPPSERRRAMTPGPPRRNVHEELRPTWDCGAGGSLSCRGDAVMVGGSIPFGSVPKALPVIPPSTLRGDDDALRPKPPAD